MDTRPKLLIAFSLLVFASSCCRNDKCEWDPNSEIVFVINEDTTNGGFNENETNIIEYKIVNPISQVVEDSGLIIKKYRGRQNNVANIGFTENTDMGSPGSLKNKNLIFFLRGTNYTDTVFNINFLLTTSSKNCGSCFLSGPSYVSIVTLSNRKAKYRGKEFDDEDFPLPITKKR